ncbi:tRNA A-37 threonylcarbamoyl transferase component Bud32 [Evansella vedderi]|uniref:tRNA A-37 threonylcarbamoyl transferase component Bud32 n=1 Tax=Evansella vedderi TaxID=38282 RepID=A0ABU0A2Q2_9BACI|nr:aminoglycoside phosphotransferase family protein [Evansella vedderi]MDQ0257763.1 tRNA A-37 threonylcarbamoyl transferase component Bud32 [Evansella vedderi]
MEKERVVGKGNTAEVVVLDEDKVAKIFHENIDVFSINEEFRKSKVIAEAGLNVPNVFHQQIINGKQAIIFEKVEGLPLHWVIENKPLTALIHIQMMSKLHVDVHRYRGLNLPSMTETLVNKIERVSELYVDERKKVIDHLLKLPVEDTLCHGDFHPRNIILSDKGPIIIDWSDATIGNRHADLARTILILTYGGFPENISTANFHIKTTLRRLISFYYLYFYKKLHKVEAQTYKDWILPVAATRLAENIPKMEKSKLISIVRSY